MSFFGTISSKEHNGLRLIIFLAQNYQTKKQVSLSEISQQEGISVKYLEQLILPFKKAGIITARRGRSGGYEMVKNPNEISMRDIIYLLNDNPRLVTCLEGDYDHSCKFDDNCTSKSVWTDIQKLMDDSLGKILLSEIIKK
jgi:Rrf2 family iron-sulfur cluster assembly transcriptional regulator